ncbi:unnamed protein product, partial [Discosporangium mesarthrocarpum]
LFKTGEEKVLHCSVHLYCFCLIPSFESVPTALERQVSWRLGAATLEAVRSMMMVKEKYGVTGIDCSTEMPTAVKSITVSRRQARSQKLFTSHPLGLCIVFEPSRVATVLSLPNGPTASQTHHPYLSLAQVYQGGSEGELS